jgi:hypothetical protein
MLKKSISINHFIPYLDNICIQLDNRGILMCVKISYFAQSNVKDSLQR